MVSAAEADECGSMNMWLASAPRAQVADNPLGCDISLDDLCDRPPRAVAPDEVLDLGGKQVRMIPTPHVPHGWEAQVLFEATTSTLLCGDLLTPVVRGLAELAPTTSGIMHGASYQGDGRQALYDLADGYDALARIRAAGAGAAAVPGARTA